MICKVFYQTMHQTTATKIIEIMPSNYYGFDFTPSEDTIKNNLIFDPDVAIIDLIESGYVLQAGEEIDMRIED